MADKLVPAAVRRDDKEHPALPPALPRLGVLLAGEISLRSVIACQALGHVIPMANTAPGSLR